MTEIRKYLEEHKKEMTDLLAELVAVKSVQGEAENGYPFGREPAKALEIMLKSCENSGFAVENVENYVGSADFGESPELAVLSHLDVVPVGDDWSADPFILRYDEKTDKLIGRGTIDDKGPAVASLFALKAVKELGIPLKKGVRLIFGTNEENGSADLAYYRRKRELPKMVFTPDGEYPVINGEKGMVRTRFSTLFTDGTIKAGTVINAVPNRCEFSVNVPLADGVKAYFGTVEGTAAHASIPENGENAVTKFLSEIQNCDGFNNDVLKTLSKLFPHGETDGKSLGICCEDDISGKTTCVLSMLNTENGRIYGAVDVRFPIKCELFNIKEQICGKLRENGFHIDYCEGTEPHYTDGDSEFVKSLNKVYERVTGEKGGCICIGGGTYVHEIDGGVAFGAEMPGKSGNMHGAEEFITLEGLLLNAEIMAEAVIEICG